MEQLRKRVADTVIALDGKALKHASTDGVHIPYVVSAWSCEGGFAMGEVKTDEKSNAITALPVLLTTLGREREGCTVTIDASMRPLCRLMPKRRLPASVRTGASRTDSTGHSTA